MFQKIFDYDNPVWRFIGELCDMALLNLLWILCCLPVVTAGAATTALYYCTLRVTRKEDAGICKMFFQSFRENLKQAVVIELFLTVVALWIGINLRILSSGLFGSQTFAQNFFLFVTGVFALLWALVFLYVFPLQARFQNPVRQTLLNAVLLPARYPGKTILLLVTDAGMFLLAYGCLAYLPQLSPVIFLLWIPLIAWMNSRQFEQIFQTLNPQPEADSSAFRE